MNPTRRSFLGGALALIATPTIAKIVPAFVPVIHGDGVHDDVEGLEALLSGKPFRLAEDVPGVFYQSADKVVLSGGRFFISRSINIQFKGDVTISMCHFLVGRRTSDTLFWIGDRA